jgi:hypothetical protein
VSSISAIPADFAFSGEFETFRRAFMRFNFWHQNILEKYHDPTDSHCEAIRAFRVD